MIALNATALFAAMVFMPVFFQVVLGFTSSHAGLLMTPMMAGMIAGSVGSGHLVTRTGRYKALTLGVAAAGALLNFGLTGHSEIHEAYRNAIALNFALGSVVTAAAFLLTLRIPELPLRGAA